MNYDQCFIFQSDGSEGDQELENFEDAFETMKRAAGVDTIEEVVERFQTQEFTGKVPTVNPLGNFTTITEM